jgi:hypothetical protein
MEELRFPIGRFAPPADPAAARPELIAQIEALPAELRRAVAGLDDARLDTPYRPDGWTVRQVVHHVADSHMNGYVRSKLAVTEDEPAVKLYDEKLWAELEDAGTAPVEVSLTLLEALHERWVRFLRSLDDDALARPFLHPDYGRLTVELHLAIYAWHGRHHTAHITRLRQRQGWV